MREALTTIGAGAQKEVDGAYCGLLMGGYLCRGFEAAIGFFTDKLGLPLEWRQEDADFAGLRLPSGQLLEVFGPR